VVHSLFSVPSPIPPSFQRVHLEQFPLEVSRPYSRIPVNVAYGHAVTTPTLMVIADRHFGPVDLAWRRCGAVSHRIAFDGRA
jgi:hypothetical protein